MTNQFNDNDSFFIFLFNDHETRLWQEEILTSHFGAARESLQKEGKKP
jgi:hypothetical protein